MEQDQQLRSAQKIVEIAEKLEALTKKDGWKEYQQLIDDLITQEFAGLSGQKLDHQYYQKIGFLQMMQFIREIPNVVKDKKVREYLLHQGRMKALQVAKGGLLGHYRKQKAMAIQKIRQIMGMQNTEINKDAHSEQVYNEEG
jgi:hypothetical protein